MARKPRSNKNEDRFTKEIRQIRNLLILIARKVGATADEVDYATRMGAANIRAMFPVKRGKKQARRATQP